jgi:hypothetical protein
MEIIDWSKLEGYAHAAKLAEIALGKARVEIAENERLLAEIKAKMRELLVPEVKPVPLATVPVLLKVRTCRVCGCTEAKACLTAVGCGWWWIDDPEGGDLCSECDPTLQAALAAETAIQCETTVVHSDGAQLMEEQGEWVAMDAAFDMPMRMPAVSITIDPPVGSEVDQWAENFGFKRGEGESDVELRVRVRDKILNAPRARCNYLDCQNLQEPRMNYCAEHLQPRVPTSEQAPAAPEVSGRAARCSGHRQPTGAEGQRAPLDVLQVPSRDDALDATVAWTRDELLQVHRLQRNCGRKKKQLR